MSSIQVAKSVQGYVNAGARPACRNCRHGEEQLVDRMPPHDRAGWHCQRGGFMVTAMAVCDRHQTKHQAQPKPAE